MHLVHILTSIKIARCCQTSGFQWKAARGACLISLPDPIPPGFGSLHTYSLCITTTAHSQAPAAFLSSFSTCDFWNNPSKCPTKILPLHHHPLIPPFTSTPMKNANQRTPGCLQTAAHKDFTISTAQSARFAYIVTLCVCEV